MIAVVNNTTLAQLSDKSVEALLAQCGTAQFNVPGACSLSAPPRLLFPRHVPGCLGNVVSDKVRAACGARHNKQCRICRVVSVAQPITVQGRNTVDSWSLVAMFEGLKGTARVKPVTLDPERNAPHQFLQLPRVPL